MDTTESWIPETMDEAELAVQSVARLRLSELTSAQFQVAWNAIAYLYPELHPDSVDEPEGGWTHELRPFVIEAWRRYEAGELSEDELYPADAQWCGLCDRIEAPSVEESTRRMQFVRRPMIRVGDIVRYRKPFPDEVGIRFVITEWNIDRGFGRMLHTGMSIVPSQLLRFRDIEAVGSVDG